MRPNNPERCTAVLACLFLAALIAACEPTGPPVDREAEKRESFTRPEAPKGAWQDTEIVLPAYPLEENLVEAEISGPKRFKFLVDTSSIAVNATGVVRYTLVARSNAGAENVSFEGMRCETRQYTAYAYGSPDRTWSPARSVNWLVIENLPSNNVRHDLHRFYFCPYAIAQTSSANVIEALEHGMPHPEGR
jgi:hypothetical protein